MSVTRLLKMPHIRVILCAVCLFQGGGGGGGGAGGRGGLGN